MCGSTRSTTSPSSSSTRRSTPCAAGCCGPKLIVKLRRLCSAIQLAPSLPRRAGLSHMTDEAKEEGIVPAGGFDLLAHGHVRWVGSDDVDREAAKNREIFRSVVLPAAVGILREDDVEEPVQLVLDGPMTANDPEQPLGSDVFGEQIVADDRLAGAHPRKAPARGDTGHRRNARKVLSDRQCAVAHDGGSSPFAPIVRAGFEPFDPAARARTGKAAHHRREQLALVLLEGQGVIATSLEH